MSLSEDPLQVTRNPTGFDVASATRPSVVDFKKEIEKVALFVAQSWKDDHPNAQLNSDLDLSNCIAYVTVEMAGAASVVGGPVGLEILTGGGSEAACVVCKQVLSARL